MPVNLLQLRKQALELLGGQCKRCGFADRRALQFDHVNGDGAEERRKHGNSQHELMYRAIIGGERHHYQILCANCNCIKKAEKNEHNASAYSHHRRALKQAEVSYLIREQERDKNGRKDKPIYGPASPVKVFTQEEIEALNRLRSKQA